VVLAPLILCLLFLVLITLVENVCLIFKYDVRTECSLREAFILFEVFLRAICLVCLQSNNSYARAFSVS